MVGVVAGSNDAVAPTSRYTGMFSCASLQVLPSARFMFLIRLLSTSSMRSHESSAGELDMAALQTVNEDCPLRLVNGDSPKCAVALKQGTLARDRTSALVYIGHRHLFMMWERK